MDNGQWTMDNCHLSIISCCFAILFTIATVTSCSSGGESSSNTSTKFKQYYNQGEQLYITHCSNCHQKNGRGLGLVYPPLDTSDYMQQHFSEVLCLIKNGKSGELLVNGKSYNQPMQGVATLTDLEIAEIATYIYNSWSHQQGLIEVKQVRSALDSCTTK